jgi:predicted CXXCH cytochrome family protein
MTRNGARPGLLRRYVAPLALGVVALAAAALVLRAGNNAPALPATASAAAQGPCLRSAAEMRRIHPTLLKHERQAAVREGKRDPQARIERCVTCHVVRDASGAAVSAEDPRHFCRTCHDQVAVRIDCFSCHRSTPPATLASGAAR